MEPYLYPRRLSKDEIRLITLLRCEPGDEAGLVRCRLEVFCLESHPSNLETGASMNFDQYVPNPPKEEFPIVKYAGRKGESQQQEGKQSLRF
jgi:hypothetical protein